MIGERFRSFSDEFFSELLKALEDPQSMVAQAVLRAVGIRRAQSIAAKRSPAN